MMPFFSITQTPSVNIVIPGTVAVKAVEVEVESHSPYGIEVAFIS